MTELNKTIQISGKIERSPGKGGWTFARIPPESVLQLQTIAQKRGTLPLVIQLDDLSWGSSMMSMGQQQWFVPIMSKVQVAKKLHVDDVVTLSLSPDRSRIK